jgi:hypothetical protein
VYLLNNTVEGVKEEEEQSLRLVRLLISPKARDLNQLYSLDKVLFVEIVYPLDSL